MADEFGQKISGLHLAGDTIDAEHKHIAVLARKGTTYDYLDIDPTSGALKVDIVDASGITLTIDQDAVTDGQAVAGGEQAMIIAGSDGTNFQFILTDANGAIAIQDNGSSITVDAIDLDIRNLSASQDNVAISDGTNTLSVNADGSINVVGQFGRKDSTHLYGSANLVKDTPTTVVTESPTATTNYTGVIVSGAGYCEWSVKFGTTLSEAVIYHFWTTPTCPTQYVPFPEMIEVVNGETILIEATNREKMSSPGSDFTGHATLIKEA